MPLHLNERRNRKPGPVRFVAPQSCRKTQNTSHDSKISVDGPWAQALAQSCLNVRGECVVMYTFQGQRANEGIEYRQRSVISLNTALVLILVEELGGSFAKGVLALFAKQMYLPGLGHSACEQRFGLNEVLGARALADSLAIDDLVNVPDATAKQEARRPSPSRRHRDGLKY
ncbi:MAG TPA: hypothetical protein VGD54_16150 [Steroidobacteraceae bacterium]